MNTFVVTTHIQGKSGEVSRSEIWNQTRPLSIGHPMRFVLEKNPSGGLRIRKLALAGHAIERAWLQEVPALRAGQAPLSVVLEEGLRLTIQAARMGWEGAMESARLTTLGVADLGEAQGPSSKKLGFGLAGLSVLLLSSLWLLPKSPIQDTSEVIPEEFTKIVLNQRVKQEMKAPAPAAGELAPSKTPDAIRNVPKTVEKSAVAQAFKAQALQNSVSSLLKGGVTSLLAQSDFVKGNTGAVSLRQDLSKKSAALSAEVQGVHDLNQAPRIDVAAVGGEGVSANGQKIGYKGGVGAAVNGQGKSHVKISPQVDSDLLGANISEGLTKDQVGEVIHRHLSEIRYCYETAMLRNSDVAGKLAISFAIGGKGLVTESSIKQSTLDDPRLDDCILRRLNTWKFPQPSGGVTVQVTYPFIFKALGR
jgi:TonB family protein